MPDDRIGIHYAIDISKLKNSMVRAKAELNKFNQSISKVTKKISAPKGMTQTFAGTGAELKKMGISATTTTKQFERMNFTALEHTKIAKNTRKQISNLEKGLARTGKATAGASRQYDRLSKRLDHSQFQIRKQTSAMGDARRAQERWSASGMKAMMLSQTAWIASGAIIFGVLSTIREGIQTFMDFNQGLIDAAAITQATSAGFERMRVAAMNAFTSSTMGAKEATEALKILGQAGMDATDSAIALETVFKVTTATGGSTTEVVKFLTTAINVWKLSAEEAAKVGNILGAALNYSKLEVTDLGVIFNYVAAMARSVGMSIEELAATMAVMSNAGIKASTIGTGLRGVMSKLLSSSGKLEKELAKVDLKFKDVSLSSHTLMEALETLAKAGFDLKNVFTGLRRREAAALIVMLEQGVDRFNLMTEALRDTTAIQVMFERSMRGMKNQIILTGHQIQAVLIDMLKVAEPLIIGTSKSIQALVDALRVLAPILIGVVGAFTLWKVGALLMAASTARATLTIASATVKVGLFHKALMFLKGHPIFAGLSLLVLGYTAVSAAIDAATESTEELINKNNEEIDDLRKLQILMMDVNRTNEEKLRILDDYSKKYTFLLPLLLRETIILEDFLSLSTKEITVRKDGTIAAKEQQIARKEATIALMEEREELIKNSKLLSFMAKLTPYATPGTKLIKERKEELAKLRKEFEILTGKGPKIISGKPRFEFTAKMKKELEELRYDQASALEQARKDYAEDLTVFAMTEKSKNEVLKMRLEERTNAEKEYLAAKKELEEMPTLRLPKESKEYKAQEDLTEDLKIVWEERETIYANMMEGLARVTSKYNNEIAEINSKAAIEENKQMEEWALFGLKKIKAAQGATEKIAGFEETYRKTQSDQQKRAMKERLTEHEYNQWLAKTEFEEEQANNVKRIADLNKFKTALLKTKIPKDQLKPLIDDIDDLIKKWEESGKKLKIEDFLPYDPKDMVGGFKKGIDEMVDGWINGYELMRKFAKDAFQDIQSTFSNLVYDNMIGELKSINDYWKVLKNAILRHIADIAAKQIMAGVAGGFDWLGAAATLGSAALGIFGMGGTTPTPTPSGMEAGTTIPLTHTGGAVDGNVGSSFKSFSDAIRMHSGGEVMRILKKGEYVLQDSAAKSIGRGKLDEMNRTGQLPDKQPQIIDRRTTVNYIQAIDAASFEQTLREKGGRAIYDMSLNSYSAARGKRDPRVINR